MSVPKECRFCDLLKPMKETLSEGEDMLPEEEYRYRCTDGRLDITMGDGTKIPNSWAFSTIVLPGKVVAEAQKDCPSFRVSRNLANMYPRLAKKFGIEPPLQDYPPGTNAGLP